jgi:tRNA U34 5-methylaminomethyl-2-thiouridine-forming methyltransferase MnmC
LAVFNYFSGLRTLVWRAIGHPYCKIFLNLDRTANKKHPLISWLGVVMRFEDIVETQDGSLTIRDHGSGECYHSTEGALLESRELYINRSGIKEKLQQNHPIAVLDIGLGLAYNALSTIDEWYLHGSCDLTVVSLEKEPELVAQLAQGIGSWQSKWPRHWMDWSLSLSPVSELSHDESTPSYTAKIIHPQTSRLCLWKIHLGDAALMRELPMTFDFFWQDPFSPEKNPELWSSPWFALLIRYSNPGAVLMSYSVARKTKDALTLGGFNVERMETPTRKKHWLKANASGLVKETLF